MMWCYFCSILFLNKVKDEEIWSFSQFPMLWENLKNLESLIFLKIL